MKTCIVIPCYNEAQRLSAETIFTFIKSHREIHISLINDGSTDSTIEILKSIQKENPDQISVIDLKQNVGKAEAVRLGVLAARAEKKYEYIIFLDADFSTSLDECLRFIDHAKNNCDIKVICGSRIKRMGADIRRSAKRHYLGRAFASLSYFVLPLPMYDTQCGAKLFRSDITELAFSNPFVSKWLFDIEILLRISSSIGYEKALDEIYEIPLLKWVEIGGSKIGFKSFIGLPLELVKINVQYKPLIGNLKRSLKHWGK